MTITLPFPVVDHRRMDAVMTRNLGDGLFAFNRFFNHDSKATVHESAPARISLSHNETALPIFRTTLSFFASIE